jgi:toxin ParE1/3/4
MQLLFSPLAQSDLEDIGDYIALDNPRRAQTFIQEIRTECQKIVNTPLGFRLREDLAPGLRVLPFGRYLIFYRALASAVRIERILHSARDLGPLFDIDPN